MTSMRGMGGTLYRFRAEMRHGGWRFVLVTALLLGIGGGIALAAIAGARRTETAFTRMEDATFAADVLVNPDDIETFNELTDERIGAIPGVETWGRVYGILTIPTDGSFIESAFLAAADDL